MREQLAPPAGDASVSEHANVVNLEGKKRKDPTSAPLSPSEPTNIPFIPAVTGETAVFVSLRVIPPPPLSLGCRRRHVEPRRVNALTGGKQPAPSHVSNRLRRVQARPVKTGGERRVSAALAPRLLHVQKRRRRLRNSFSIPPSSVPSVAAASPL